MHDDEVDPPYTTINLKNHLFLIILLPMLFSALVLGSVGFLIKQRELQKQFISQGEVILLYFKTLGEHTLVNQNINTLKSFSSELVESESIRSVHLYTVLKTSTQNTLPIANDPHAESVVSSGVLQTDAAPTNMKTLFRSGPRMRPQSTSHYFKDLFKPHRRFTTTLQVNTNDHQHIVLEFELDRHWLLIWQREILILYWFVNIVCVFLTMLFANYAATKYSDPIRAISFAASRIREGRLSTRVKNRAPKGELNELTWGINSMAKSLQHANDEMQNNIDQATQDLRDTLETIEIQNIELDISRKEAEHANRVKSQFLANISHEVRTPLNSITGFTKLLMKSELNPKQSDYLNSIHKSSNNLLAIINDILDFSKIEAGKLSLEIAPFDIRKTLNEVSEILTPLAKERGLKQILLIDENVPHTIMSDPLRIKQILINLLNNAIKFSEHSSLTLRVSIENYKSEQSHMKFSVRDQGIGLSESAKDTLFQAFHQSDSSNVRRFQGTGLGLTISRQLVGMLGGEIGVESTLGEGSTFWFTLPLTKADKLSQKSAAQSDINVTGIALTDTQNTKASEIVSLPSQTASHPLTSEKNTVELNTPTILAVDDNPDNLKLLCALLEDLGINYDACNNGRDAISLSKEKDYDLIFMDIQMPILDGIETTKYIREFDTRFSKSRGIIALTAHALEEETRSLLNNGFNKCLTKPIDIELLTETIEHWTAYKRKPLARHSTPPTKKTELSNLELIDIEQGLRLSGGKVALANEMLEGFMQNLSSDWLAIKDVSHNNHQEQLLERVHYLHGACAYCGVPLLQQAISNLEKKLKQQDKNYQHEIEVLEKEVTHLLQAYHAMEKPIYR